MYITVWKKLPVQSPDITFDHLEWSTNVRISNNYYELVVEDVRNGLELNAIRGYWVKQFEFDPITGNIEQINETVKQIEIKPRRVINPTFV